MYERILVPIDGSAPSNHGLEEAIKLAKLTGGSIRLVHVSNEYLAIVEGYYSRDVATTLREQGEALLNDTRARVERSGVKADTASPDGIRGACSDLIIECAKEWRADLIVMGTHGRRGLSRLALGSDAENVLRASRVPVLLVRGPVTG